MSPDIKALWALIKPYGRRYLIGGLILLVCDLGQLGSPWIVGRIVDDLRSGLMTSQGLASYVGLLLGLAALVAVCRYGWRIFVFGAARKVERDLRDRLYAHLQTLSAAFYQRHKVGDLMAHATNDIQAIRGFAGEGIMAGFDSPIYIVSAITLMAFIDWRLTLASLLPLPFIALASGKLGTQVHVRYRAVQDAFSALSDRVQEAISGIRIVKGFVQETDEKARFALRAEEYRYRFMAMERFHSGFDPVISVLGGASTAVALSYGGWHVQQGVVSLGQLVTFLGLLNMLTWPMMALSWAFNLIQRATASMARLRAVFESKPDIVEASDALPMGNPTGRLEIRDLTFSYGPDRRPALQSVSVTVEPGRILGVVGRTGSGKSTLVSLLLRQYDPPPGTVFLDGVDIRSIRFADLRAAIGMVPQDGFLFSRSIALNVDFGPLPRTRETVTGSLKLAAMLEEVEDLPDGFETMLGERGITLSGGQRQRVSLARAAIKAPKVLILDDSLSAVDAETETRILKGLDDYMEDRTTILVAHRLSIVRHADHILLLEEGRVEEQGSHDQLLAHGGSYARMWEQQRLEAALAAET